MPTQTVFEQQMDEMRADMREMRGAITKVAEAVSKMAVLEERNMAVATSLEKLVTRVERMEYKVGGVELMQAKFESKVSGITSAMRLMWGAFGGGVAFMGVQAIKHFAMIGGGS